MKAIQRTALLTVLHETVDLHLSEATRIFQNLTSEQLLRQPAPGAWSAAQCFEHLNKYGDYYLPQIRKAIERSRSSKTNDMFASSWLGSYFTKMMDPNTGRKKIKTFKEYLPASQLDAHAVVAEFIHQQETILKYVDLAHDADLNARIAISLTKLIRLKLGDVLQFVIAHDARHLEQAKRAIA
jgi:hypothetical protein